MDRRVRKTRSLIKTAFLELLKEKEFSALTITELASRADIDRRTFYLHYSCLEDIMDEIEKEAADSLNQLLLSMKEFNMTALFKGLTQIVNENLDFLRIIAGNDNYHRFIAKCKDHLKRMMHEVFFETSKLSEVDFDIYTEYIASGIIGVYCNWALSYAPITLDELTIKAENAVSGAWDMITSK